MWKHLCPLKTPMLCSLVTEPARICMLRSLTQSGGFFYVFCRLWAEVNCCRSLGSHIPCRTGAVWFSGHSVQLVRKPESPCAAKTCGRSVAWSSTAARLLPKITLGTKPTGLPLSARTSLSVEVLAWILGHRLQR